MLQFDPFGGHLFVSLDRRRDLLKRLFWHTQGLVRGAKPLERGRFAWPQAREGSVWGTLVQLSVLPKDVDWRMPGRTWQDRAFADLVPWNWSRVTDAGYRRRLKHGAKIA